MNITRERLGQDADPPGALILAAGESRRFWPLSSIQHKSLFRLHGTSLLERTIRSLVEIGIRRIGIVQSTRSHYPRPEEVILPSDCLPTRYGDCLLHFVEQPIVAGQGDAILRGADLFGSSFFVVQPENINAGNIASELLAARMDGDLVVVAGQERSDYSLYAVLEHHAQRLTSIVEKPDSADSRAPLCSMGVYLFAKEFIDCLTVVKPGAMSIIDAIDLAAKAGRAGVVKSSNIFLPLKFPGHLWAYVRHLGLEFSLRGSSIVNATCHELAQGQCLVSEGCVIGEVCLDNMIIGPNVVIGSGTRTVEQSTWDDLNAVVIGQGATIGPDVLLTPGVRIGAGANIGRGLSIDADVPDMAVVSAKSLVL